MPPYAIDIDEERRILRATLRGFWDVEITSSYLADLRAAGVQVSRGGAPSWWLIHMIDYVVQSRDVTDLMRDNLPSIFRPGATLAVVIAASLQSMQAKRVVPNEHHRHFSTLADAERWLTDQGMPA